MTVKPIYTDIQPKNDDRTKSRNQSDIFEKVHNDKHINTLQYIALLATTRHPGKQSSAFKRQKNIPFMGEGVEHI